MLPIMRNFRHSFIKANYEYQITCFMDKNFGVEFLRNGILLIH